MQNSKEQQCSRCDGTGKVTEYYTEKDIVDYGNPGGGLGPYDLPIYGEVKKSRWETCPNCNGSGHRP